MKGEERGRNKGEEREESIAKQQSSVEGGGGGGGGGKKACWISEVDQKKTHHTIKRCPSEEQRAAKRGEEDVNRALSVRSSNG